MKSLLLSAMLALIIAPLEQLSSTDRADQRRWSQPRLTDAIDRLPDGITANPEGRPAKFSLARLVAMVLFLLIFPGYGILLTM